MGLTQTSLHPFPDIIWRHGQRDGAGRLSHQIDHLRGNLAPLGGLALDASEALAHGPYAVIPMPPLEMPPQAMRLEYGAMAAGADRHNALMQRSSL